MFQINKGRESCVWGTFDDDSTDKGAQLDVTTLTGHQEAIVHPFNQNGVNLSNPSKSDPAVAGLSV